MWCDVHMSGFLCAINNQMDIWYWSSEFTVMDLIKGEASLITGNFSTPKATQLESLLQERHGDIASQLCAGIAFPQGRWVLRAVPGNLLMGRNWADSLGAAGPLSTIYFATYGRSLFSSLGSLQLLWYLERAVNPKPLAAAQHEEAMLKRDLSELSKSDFLKVKQGGIAMFSWHGPETKMILH